MNWFVVGAVVALVLAGVMLYLSRDARARHRKMYLTETTTTGTLRSLQEAAASAAGAGAFQQQVELAGKAVAGPGGLLTSEMSKTSCVWHHHRVTRKYRKVSHDSKGNRQTSTAEEVVTENVTHDSFLLRDAEGDITLVPGDEVDGARKALSEFREGDRDRVELFGFSFAGNNDGDTLGYEYEEWVLAPDTAIFVQGEVSDRDGTLRVTEPEEKGDFVISTRSEAALLKKADHAARLYGWLAVAAGALALVLLVVGFVR